MPLLLAASLTLSLGGAFGRVGSTTLGPRIATTARLSTGGQRVEGFAHVQLVPGADRGPVDPDARGWSDLAVLAGARLRLGDWFGIGAEAGMARVAWVAFRLPGMPASYGRGSFSRALGGFVDARIPLSEHISVAAEAGALAIADNAGASQYAGWIDFRGTCGLALGF